MCASTNWLNIMILAFNVREQKLSHDHKCERPRLFFGQNVNRRYVFLHFLRFSRTHVTMPWCTVLSANSTFHWCIAHIFRYNTFWEHSKTNIELDDVDDHTFLLIPVFVVKVIKNEGFITVIMRIFFKYDQI